MYRNGQGVDVNHKKAIEWYKKAAEQGDAEAQCTVGGMYRHGQGVDKCDSSAMRWFAKAAAQGFEEAQAAIDDILVERRSTKQPNKKRP